MGYNLELLYVFYQEVVVRELLEIELLSTESELCNLNT